MQNKLSMNGLLRIRSNIQLHNLQTSCSSSCTLIHVIWMIRFLYSRALFRSAVNSAQRRPAPSPLRPFLAGIFLWFYCLCVYEFWDFFFMPRKFQCENSVNELQCRTSNGIVHRYLIIAISATQDQLHWKYTHTFNIISMLNISHFNASMIYILQTKTLSKFKTKASTSFCRSVHG